MLRANVASEEELCRVQQRKSRCFVLACVGLMGQESSYQTMFYFNSISSGLSIYSGRNRGPIIWLRAFQSLHFISVLQAVTYGCRDSIVTT